MQIVMMIFGLISFLVAAISYQVAYSPRGSKHILLILFAPTAVVSFLGIFVLGILRPDWADPVFYAGWFGTIAGVVYGTITKSQAAKKK